MMDSRSQRQSVRPLRTPITTLSSPLHRSGGLWRDALRRTRRTCALTVVAAVAIAAAYQLRTTVAQPGRAIRSELLAAAGELSSQIVANPTEPERLAMRRHFREAEVEVDTAQSWPNVLVKLRDLDRATCEAAVRDARRMEGLVVVSLDAYRSPADCGERNDMTWWVMP
jgi:hypothetical protein